MCVCEAVLRTQQGEEPAVWQHGSNGSKHSLSETHESLSAAATGGLSAGLGPTDSTGAECNNRCGCPVLDTTLSTVPHTCRTVHMTAAALAWAGALLLHGRQLLLLLLPLVTLSAALLPQQLPAVPTPPLAAMHCCCRWVHAGAAVG